MDKQGFKFSCVLALISVIADTDLDRQGQKPLFLGLKFYI